MATKRELQLEKVKLKQNLEEFYKKNDLQSVERIVQNYRDQKYAHNISIMYAIEYCPFAEVKTLLNHELADINWKSTLVSSKYHHASFLHCAVWLQKVEVVQYLLEKGISVDIENNSNESPLFFCKSTEIAQLLLDHGAQLDHTNVNDETVLFKQISAEVAQLVVDNGAQLDHMNTRGRTALHDAANSNYIEMLNILLLNGARMDLQDNDGMTPLDVANIMGSDQSAELLKEAMQKEEDRLKKMENEENDNNSTEPPEPLPVTTNLQSTTEESLEVDDRILKETDLREIMTATLEVTDCYNLGLELHIPPDVLDNMEKDFPNPSKFHRKMLMHWLCTGCASWLKLANALREPLVNEKGLADQITINHPLRKSPTSPKSVTEDETTTSKEIEDRCYSAFNHDRQEEGLTLLKQVKQPHTVKGEYSFTLLHCAAHWGWLDTVKLLITEYNCDPNQVDSRGLTPLHVASSGGHLDVLQYLIDDQKCDPLQKDDDGETSVDRARFFGKQEVVEYLTGTSSDIETKCYDAFNYGRREEALRLLKLVKDPHTVKSKNNFTLLHCAAYHGWLDVVKELIIEHQFNPNCEDKDGNTPLSKATGNGKLTVVDYLETSIAALDKKCYDAFNYNRREEALRLLKQVKDPRTVKSKNNFTILHCAAFHGWLDGVKELIIEHQFDADCEDDDGNTPLSKAKSNGKQTVVDYLESVIATGIEDKKVVDQCFEAFNYGRREEALRLQRKIKNLHTVMDSNNFTILHCAAYHGWLDVVKELIVEHQFNPGCKDDDGNTPLSKARSHGKQSVVEYLETAIAEVETKCYDAFNYGRMEEALRLLKQVKDPRTVKSKNNFTILHCAAYHGWLDVVKELIIEHQFNPNCEDKDGNTPLSKATSNGKVTVVAYLKKVIATCKEDKEVVDQCFEAFNYGRREEALRIMKKIKDPRTVKDSSNFTILHCAAYHGWLDVVEELITEHQFIPHCEDKDGNTPLITASNNEKQSVVDYLETVIAVVEKTCYDAFNYGRKQEALRLVKQVKDPRTVKSKNNFTLLHCAAYHGWLDVVKEMITENRFNPDCEDKDGNTPLSKARSNGKLTVVDYLETFIDEVETKCYDAFNCGKRKEALGLLKQVKDPRTVKSKNDFTLLHCAAYHGWLDVVKELITEHQFNPDCKDKYGNTPLSKARGSGERSVVDYLETYIAEVETKCYDAFNNGRQEEALRLLKQVEDPRTVKSKNNFTILHCAAYRGWLDVVKELITEHQFDADCVDDVGNTPLSKARNNRKQHVVDYLETLIETQCYDAFNYGRREEALRLLKQVEDPRTVKSRSNFTILHCAAYHGWLDVVKELIVENDFNPDCEDDDGITPLSKAITNGKQSVVDYLKAVIAEVETKCYDAFNNGRQEEALRLLKQVEDPRTVKSKNNFTILHCAAYRGWLDVVKELITEHQFDADCKDDDGNTPLSKARSNGQQPVVDYLETLIETQCYDAFHYGRREEAVRLLKQVKDPRTVKSENDFTLLHCAAYHGWLDVVKEMITEHQFNPECEDKDGNTPLSKARGNGKLTVVDYLETFIAEVETKCYDAFDNGRREEAVRLLKQVKDPRTVKSKNNFTILHCAAHQGWLDVVKELIIEHQLNTVCVDNDGNTPLCKARNNGKQDVVDYLETVIAEVETQCYDAFSYGRQEEALRLLKQVEDPRTVKNKNKFTLLHCAAHHGWLDIVKELITEHQFNPECEDKDGNTPLSKARSNKKQHVVDYLEKIIAEVEMKCYDAFNEGRQEEAVTLMKQVKDPRTVKSKSNFTVLHYAAYHGWLDIVKELITEHQFNPDCEDKDGNTPLSKARSNGKQPVVDYLEKAIETQCYDAFYCGRHEEALRILKKIEDPRTMKSNNNVTILHHAAYHGWLDVVKELINEYEFNPDCKDDKGITPLRKAKANGKENVVQYLKKEKNSNQSLGVSHEQETTTGNQREQEKFRTLVDFECQRKPNASGIAFIIGISGPNGIDIDIKNMSSTFEGLNFAVLSQSNLTASEVLSLLNIAPSFVYPLSYKFVAFYFAGHGGIDHNGRAYILPLQLRKQGDLEKVYIEEAIVSPFSDKRSPSLKYRCRILLFDCCLATQSMRKDPDDPSSEPQKFKLEAPGGCLVAYATSRTSESEGDKQRGGLWTSHLHNNLKLPLPISVILDRTHDAVKKESIASGRLQESNYHSNIGEVYLKEGSEMKSFAEAAPVENSLQGTFRSMPHESIDTSPKKQDSIRSDVRQNSQDTSIEESDSGATVLKSSSNTSSILMKQPDLFDAYDQVKGKSADWQDLARALRIKMNDRASMPHDKPNECLERILNIWIQSETCEVTWNKLIKALKDEGMTAQASKVLEYLNTKEAQMKYT